MFRSHYLVKGKIFGKDLLNVKCVLRLTSETFLFTEEFGEVSRHVYVCIHVKCPLFLSDINWIRTFYDNFFEK